MKAEVCLYKGANKGLGHVSITLIVNDDEYKHFKYISYEHLRIVKFNDEYIPPSKNEVAAYKTENVHIKELPNSTIEAREFKKQYKQLLSKNKYKNKIYSLTRYNCAHMTIEILHLLYPQIKLKTYFGLLPSTVFKDVDVLVDEHGNKPKDEKIYKYEYTKDVITSIKEDMMKYIENNCASLCQNNEFNSAVNDMGVSFDLFIKELGKNTCSLRGAYVDCFKNLKSSIEHIEEIAEKICKDELHGFKILKYYLYEFLRIFLDFKIEENLHLKNLHALKHQKKIFYELSFEKQLKEVEKDISPLKLNNLHKL